MSAVHAFFSQRKKAVEQGGSTSEEATLKAFTKIETPAAISVPSSSRYHVAVQGCCHGELTRIYDACAQHERETGKKIDLLICCGDFQSIRGTGDLCTMAVPDKYKALGDFHLYYSQDPDTTSPARIAPYLTLFVGGNHENSDWLAEESYGGFVAPNIYYLGHSGVVEVDGKVTVAGLSGIFKALDYNRPYPDRPYFRQEAAKRSAYHVRRVEVEKLRTFFSVEEQDKAKAHEQNAGATTTIASFLSSPSSPRPVRNGGPLVDIMVSHDWPVGITKYGNEEQLLRYKPYFKDDIAHNALGNPHTLRLLRQAQPRFWLAAHLHCFFEAQVPPSPSATTTVAASSATRFIALDKCAKGSGFLDFIDVPVAPAPEEKASSEKETIPITASSKVTSGEVRSEQKAGATVAGADRIRRHPRWVQVLEASHPYIARNECARDDAIPSAATADGFSVSVATEAILALEKNGSEKVRIASRAANTFTCLAALGIEPALPLQWVAANSSSSNTTSGSGGCGDRTSSWNQQSLHHSQRYRGRQQYVEPLPSLSSPSNQNQNVMAGHNNTTDSSEGGALSWAEDIGQ